MTDARDHDLTWLAPVLLEEATLADRVDLLAAHTSLLLRGVRTGVALVRRGVRVDTGPPDPQLSPLERLQRVNGVGPDCDVLAGRDLLEVSDVRDEGRWPRWAHEADRAGLRSMVAVRLRVRSATVGSLACYAPTPGHFGPADVRTLQLIARRAAPTLASAGERARLWETLDARRVTAMAEGVLMEAYGLGGAEAADVLTRSSRARRLTRHGWAGQLVGYMAQPMTLRLSPGESIG